MTRFVVMVPPSRLPAAEAVFVRDRFSWLAFLFPFVWLLWNRLWLATLGFVAASAAVAFAFRAVGSGYGQFAILALCALVALEGPAAADPCVPAPERPDRSSSGCGVLPSRSGPAMVPAGALGI